MTHEDDSQTDNYYRYPARVFARLHRDYITVILCPDIGLADGGVPAVLPLESVPPDLRMPNSEFDVLSERKNLGYMRVVRKGNADADWERSAWG